MIGVFGGTFDPIHFGHLRAALELYQRSRFTEIRFVPCQQPVHKKKAMASAKHRLKMLELAIADQPGFVIDERELRRKTPSFMVETLETIQAENPHETLGLIVGSDAIVQFNTWKSWETIIKIAKPFVLPRQLLISSTQIREEIKAGRSARYWLPDSVWSYIQTHDIYHKDLS